MRHKYVNKIRFNLYIPTLRITKFIWKFLNMASGKLPWDLLNLLGSRRRHLHIVAGDVGWEVKGNIGRRHWNKYHSSICTIMELDWWYRQVAYSTSDVTVIFVSVHYKDDIEFEV